MNSWHNTLWNDAEIEYNFIRLSRCFYMQLMYENAVKRADISLVNISWQFHGIYDSFKFMGIAWFYFPWQTWHVHGEIRTYRPHEKLTFHRVASLWNHVEVVLKIFIGISVHFHGNCLLVCRESSDITKNRTQRWDTSNNSLSHQRHTSISAIHGLHKKWR